MNHRIFERTLRPLVFRGACLFERHFNPSSAACVMDDRPALPHLGEGDAPEKQWPGRDSGSWANGQQTYASRTGRLSGLVSVRDELPYNQVDLGSGRDTR